MQDIPEKAFDINTLSCYVCNYTASTKSNFKNHIYSMKHYRNIQKMDDAVDQLLEKANVNRFQDISIPSYDATFSDTSIAHTPPPSAYYCNAYRTAEKGCTHSQTPDKTNENNEGSNRQSSRRLPTRRCRRPNIFAVI